MRSNLIDAGVDVFIVGAGPAGAAAAISLSQIAPHLRVCLADAGRDRPFRVGESVPPPIKPFLDHLGLGPAFIQADHCPSFHTLSAWGGQELIGNEFFLYVHNTGWRLDRDRFDRMLADEATRLGAKPLTATVRSLSPCAQGWRIDCGAAGKFAARFVIDASGRSALLPRLLKIPSVKIDKLVACAVFFEQQSVPDAPGADAAVIESFRDGWWYSAAIPGSRRVAMLMTDADIARQLRISQLPAWMAYLAETRHIQPLIASCRPLAPPAFWSAASRNFGSAYPFGILGIGDAISSFDPLSSQGIIKAIRSGLFASYAIADYFLRNDETGIARYYALMNREFDAYLTTRHEYYRQEQRWPDAPFWNRRH
ncbi:flavin-dependent dehydrogenase [Methylobacter tundripaludum]|uniref:Flavin-dependent dehydrogenase n=1 Tax=Methylobacter tundripaludum TaxID=173365 RepID=A0A2S6H7B8_9GAMM|nr:tryptophan 7-halogenase [Methylobacter tundripaludum]PPK73375.1 flavin-dependent dehydrogenase [Methylobacter tundripaludum]